MFMKRSETVMNVEFSGTLDGLKRSYCTRTAERLKTFAKYRSQKNNVDFLVEYRTKFSFVIINLVNE